MSDEGGEAMAEKSVLPLPPRFLAEPEGATIPEVFSSDFAGSKHRRTRILAYGDSLTAGYYDDGMCFEPYGKVLAEELGRQHGPVDVWVSGHSGLTASQLYKDADNDNIVDSVDRTGPGLNLVIKRHGPFDMVLIMLGTNDLARAFGSSTAIGSICEQIKALHGICHKAGMVTAVLSVPSNAFLSRDPEYGTTWKRLNGMLEGYASNEASKERATLFIDTGGLLPFARGNGLFESDGLHFTPHGSRQLGFKLAPLLLPFLRSQQVSMVAEGAPLQKMRWKKKEHDATTTPRTETSPFVQKDEPDP
jgi:lysophospholipase L1-like esterase